MMFAVTPGAALQPGLSLVGLLILFLWMRRWKIQPPSPLSRSRMRITIDAAGSEIAPWVAALRAQAQGEEIQVFESASWQPCWARSGSISNFAGRTFFTRLPLLPAPPERETDCHHRGSIELVDARSTHQGSAAFCGQNTGARPRLIAVSESIRQDAIRLLGSTKRKSSPSTQVLRPSISTPNPLTANAPTCSTPAAAPRQNREALLAACAI